MLAEQKLSDYVSSHGIRTSFIAKSSGIPPEFLRRAFQGKRKLSADELIRICSSLQLGLDFFGGGENFAQSKVFNSGSSC